MTRKISRSFASFLRAYGNDHPESGLVMGETLQPVVVVDDTTGLARKHSGTTVVSRLYRAALAGSFSIAAVHAGQAGLTVLKLEASANGRITVRNDGDQIAANRAAIDPPVGAPAATTAQMQSMIYTGTAVPDPNGGTEYFQMQTGEELGDLWIPPNHALILYGFAVNQVVSFFVHYREARDA